MKAPIDPSEWSDEEMRAVVEEWLRARGWVHKHHYWPWHKESPKMRVSSFGHALEREMNWDIPNTNMRM